MHEAIKAGESVEDVQYIVESFESQSFTQEMLLQFKNKVKREHYD